MFAKFKKQWSALKRLEPGQRFETQHRRHQQSAAGKSPFRRVLHLFAAAVAFAVGVVLVFIPGPAILFFLIAGALLAMQSLRVARALDWTELRGRAAVKTIRRRLGRRRAGMSSHR